MHEFFYFIAKMKRKMEHIVTLALMWEFDISSQASFSFSVTQ